MVEASVSSHLEAHSSDYYGKCEEDIFVKNSVLLNVPPAQGTEEVDQYTVEYDVSYNEDGIVVLGKSFEIIDGVLCSSHTVDIFFSKPLAPGSLSSMFPTSAILVVDGNLFGTKCDFVPEYEGAQRQVNNVGFMVIEASQVDGSTVKITGTPTVIDAIFEKQSMEYQPNSSEIGTRRRSLLDLQPPEITLPKDGPVQAKIKVTGGASASVDKLSWSTELIRIEGKWLDYYLPDLTISAEVGYKMFIKFENSLEISEKVLAFECPDEDNELCPPTEFEVFPDIAIPGVGISAPSIISKLLDIEGLAPRLGLVVSVPVTLSFKVESPLVLNVNVSVSM